jgi:hypothetical protein
MPLPAIPDALWPQILDAVGGDEAARPLLLGLGSSTPRLRALVKRLLSFRLQVAAPEVSACRTCFPEISMLRVVMVPGDVVGLSALNGIRSLHLDGAGSVRASSDHPSLSVTSLALSGSSVDLESLRHMPLLEVLSIDGLASGSSLSPLGALTRLRLLYAHNMDPLDLLALGGNVPATLLCNIDVSLLGPHGAISRFRKSGPAAVVLRWLRTLAMCRGFGV